MFITQMVDTLDLSRLTSRHRLRLIKHAKVVLAAQYQLAKQYNHTIVEHVLAGITKPTRMNHYPKGDRVDAHTGSQYFYHCHRENKENLEHGHFHCFLRYEYISKKIKPSMMPTSEKPRILMTHLIAIAMNCYGQPVRLFTINHWVSSDVWYPAKYTPKFINAYQFTRVSNPYWQLLDQWVAGMIHLFMPQITWLVSQRDDIIAKQQNQYPHGSIYHHRSLEEISSVAVDLTNYVQKLLALSSDQDK